MADRRQVLAGLLTGLAAACSAGGEPPPAGDAIACALAGAQDMADSCVIERVHENGSDILVIHHPDGGFRRLIVLPSGSLIAADGADQAVVSQEQQQLAVTLGQDRYRIPQTVVAGNAQ